MNIGQEIVQELIESTTPIVALYPGKFKPPHAGHFSVVEKASKIADKVIVIMSNLPKDEFTPENSMKVWQLYKDILPDNVQIVISGKSSPVSEVFDIIKDKTRDFIVLYGKGERTRYASIEKDKEKYSNVDIVDAGTFESLNATDLRNAIRNKDLEDIQKFLPANINAKKVLDIYSQDEFKPGPMVHEMAKSDLDGVEKYADKELNPLDIEFSKHFFDRVNDPRNDKEISTAELIGFFKRLSRNKNKFVEFLKKYQELVVKDSNTNINIPFVNQVDQVIAKTIMRKQNFSTSNPTITLESKVLDELFEKDLPNIEKVSPTEYIVSNGDDIEAKYFFQVKFDVFDPNPKPNNWSLNWKFTENNKNKSPESWKQVTATSYKILADFINSRHPNSISISGNTDIKTNIYKSPIIINKLETLFNNEYRIDNSREYEVVLRSIEESAKPNIKKRMENMNESYDQSLNYFKNGDIFSQSKIERNNTLKKYNNRKQISELYKIPFKTNILLETFTPQKAPLMKKFVEYACNELSISEPQINIINSPTYSQENHSFGGYIPSEEKILVVVHNRNMADILRTLAHELVHHMQNMNGDELNGEDGSNIENEANAMAGVIMRKFGRENPEIFE